MSVRILAIDTATEACSVALLDKNRIDSIFELCQREHTQRILPMVQQLLLKHDVKLTELDALAYGRGPGSFTGVRIATGIAQGLAFGASLPLVAISTLAALAQGAWRRAEAKRVLTAIDARMGEVYWAEYQRDHRGNWLGEESEAVLSPHTALARMAQLEGEWVLAGTGWQARSELVTQTSLNILSSEIRLPTAEDMLPLAMAALAEGKKVSAEEAEPVYLRNEVTWKKQAGHR